MAAGAPIELDVHVTRDRVPVVVHDLRLDRLCGRDLRVAATSLDELRTLRLLGTEHGIPTLGEALREVAGRVGVMVELKTYGRDVGALEQAVADVLDRYDGPVCVASFNPRTVGWFRDHRPAVPRGQASGTFAGTGLPRWLARPMRSLVSLRWTRPDFLSYELAGLPNEAVDHWRDRGVGLVTWTVTNPREAVRARRLADNYIYEGFEPTTVGDDQA